MVFWGVSSRSRPLFLRRREMTNRGSDATPSGRPARSVPSVYGATAVAARAIEKEAAAQANSDKGWGGVREGAGSSGVQKVMTNTSHTPSCYPRSVASLANLPGHGNATSEFFGALRMRRPETASKVLSRRCCRRIGRGPIQPCRHSGRSCFPFENEI
jgi:hypothetical protein